MRRIASAIAALAFASAAPAAETVDVALVLAADVSMSMSEDEIAIERAGYAAALTHETVLRAIAGGRHGRIALTFFEWAGGETQRVIVPWTIIDGPDSAARAAERIRNAPAERARRTSISGAIDFGLDLFAEAAILADRRVIDVSGDGPNNQGGPVTAARDRAIADGVIINGLPLMTRGGFSSPFDIAGLDAYYRDCVIGGPGAFVFPVNDWAGFPEAVRRKLVLEIAADEGLIVPAAVREKSDCLIGEKIWENRGIDWR